MIEVSVSALAMDKTTGTPVVLLKEVKGERVLPIWIGPFEADAISRALMGEKFRRPLTHDLIVNIFRGLGVKVLKVEISELKEDTYYAKIYLEKENEFAVIDARPSDSRAIALRAKCPIYVAEEVMEASATEIKIDEEAKKKYLQDYLKRLNPEDFGKYEI